MYGLKQRNQIIPISGTPFKIGRHMSNNIIIQSDLTVSRHHAVIVFREHKPYISDISKNGWGVFIGSQKILMNRETELQPGDVINIGSDAPSDPNCILELFSIQSDTPENSQIDDSLETQPLPPSRTSNKIETIDITDGGDTDIIVIPDEIHERDVTPAIVQGNGLSPSESTPIASSKTKPPDLKIPNESPIQHSPNPSLQTTPKVSKQQRLIYLSSDEEDDPTDDLAGVQKELANITNLAIPSTSGFAMPSTSGPAMPSTNGPAIPSTSGFAIPSTSGISSTNLVDVTSTMNGLLKPPVVNNSKPFQMTESVFVKPEPPPPRKNNALNYSKTDEIISLDSDDEDFPCSQNQFNATAIQDVSDYSDTLRGMFEIKPELQYYNEDDDVKFIGNGDSWFEPFSQSALDLKVESSKNYGKSEPIDAFTDDILDVLQDDTDAPPEETTDEPLEDTVDKPQEVPMEVCEEDNEIYESPSKEPPTFSRITKKPPMISIIPPKPQKPRKRRSSDSASFSKKDGSDSSENLLKRLKSIDVSRIKVTKESKTKDDIRRKRKEKLKQVGERKHSEPGISKPSCSKEYDAKPKVKLTDKNRGHFLTIEDEKAKMKSKKHHKSQPKKPSPPATPKSDDSRPKVPDAAKELSHSSSKRSNNSNAAATEFKAVNGSSKLTEDCAISKDDQINKIPFDRLKDQTPMLPEVLSPNSDLVFPPSSQRKILKSILKIEHHSYANTNEQPSVGKTVKFFSRNKEFPPPDYPIERFLAPYKIYDSLIRDSQLEFDTALAHVCKWSVKWLQEQQIQSSPPPLYESPYPNGQYPNCIEMYRDSLRVTLFHSLWKMMFDVWNIPGSDVLPFSQVVREQDLLTIESVDVTSKTDRPPLLWTIYARRDLNFANHPHDIQYGQLVILNFHVRRRNLEPPTRTMVFAYVASCNRFENEIRPFEKIAFKVCPKPFSIELGTAKIKILTYSKTKLRQFQALALMSQSPIIEALCDTNFHDSFENDNIPNPNKDFSDQFLDYSQKKAVASCLSCVTSKKPSVLLIEGSKGTGKSQIIVSFLKELYLTPLRSTLPQKFKILIVASCDTEADDLLYRMASANKKGGNPMNILRFGGNPDGMHTVVRECTLHKKASEEAARNQNLIDLLEEANNLRAKINSAQLVLISANAPSAKKVEAEAKVKMYQHQLEELMTENSKAVETLKYQAAKEIVIANADIVITALYSCWSSNFEMHFVPTGQNRGSIYKFDVCIFDDANLFDETSSLVPLMLHVPRLIITGDRIIRAYQGAPFEKLFHTYKSTNKDFLVNLETQHRMSPDISSWVKDFYNLSITDRSATLRRVSGLKSFLVIDHPNDLQNGITSSYEHQVSLCERILQAILQLETDETSKIGVIVAQPEQKDNIKNAIGLDIARRVKVELLDGYSAREHDVVVLCCPMKIFSEWLYIAVTRAKSSIIICGNFQDNQNVSCVVSLMDNAITRKAYVSLRKDPKQIPVDKIKKIITM